VVAFTHPGENAEIAARAARTLVAAAAALAPAAAAAAAGAGRLASADTELKRPLAWEWQDERAAIRS
jgi:hypothetical protein